MLIKEISCTSLALYFASSSNDEYSWAVLIIYFHYFTLHFAMAGSY